MKRLLSWLLALVMIISCLPLSALPAFAATETDVDTDFETEEDIIVDFAGELTPIDLTADLLNEEGFTATVTVPAGKTYHYIAYRVNGMEMTINDGEAVACVTDGTTSPYAWTITNDGEAAAEYVIKVSFPAGTLENPAELELGDNEAAIEAGNNQGYYFTYTAAGDDVLKLTISAADAEGNELGWTYVVNNMTTYKYGDQQWSDSDPVVNPAEIEVAAGQKLQIMVNTYDAANEWNNPAGTVTVNAEIVAGSESNPIDLTDDIVYEDDFAATVTVPAGDTVYYMSYGLAGMFMSINGGEATAVTGNPRVAYYWSITNDTESEAEYVISCTWPVGNSANPAVLIEGENVASIEANAQGYYYTYTAEQDGTLSITMPEGNWTYVINNLTAGTYGDTQWSDSDPVVNPGTVEVKAGEQIQVIVNTYDPADMWNNPAGTLTFNASFEAEEPAPEYNVVTSGYGLSLDAELIVSAKFLVPEELRNDPNATMTIGFINDEIEVNLMEYIAENGLDSKNRFVVKQSVKSPYMTHLINVTITDGNGYTANYTDYFGETFTGTYQFGAENYVKLMSAQPETVQNAVRALLTYGAYAQEYFSKTGTQYITEELATEILTRNGYEAYDMSGFSSDLLTQVPVGEGDDFDGISVRNSQPDLAAAIFMKVQFNASGLTSADDIANYTYKLHVVVGEQNIELDLDTPEWDNSRKRLVFYVYGIPAMFFDNMYTITITKTATGETYSGSTSIFTYMNVAYDTFSSNVEMQNLLKAMYYYNEAANIHFGK